MGSHRFRITVRTQGGHSYHDFGRPNAIAELCTLVDDLYHVTLPDETITYNVGRIEGGTTVNSIAAETSVLYEYRSTSEQALAQIVVRGKCAQEWRFYRVFLQFPHRAPPGRHSQHYQTRT